MYFTFKGISSKEFDITILRSPKFKTPDYRRYISEIPGRHGAHVKTEGFTSHTFTFDIAITEEYIPQALGWLKGRGEFSFSKQPNRYIEVDIQASVEFVHKFKDTYTSTITIYAHDATWFNKETTTTIGNSIIINEGTAQAKPIIKLTRGSVSVADVTINNTRFIYDFKGESHVTLDCEKQEAYMDEQKRNSRLTIGYIYPELKPGKNIVKSNVKIDYERKDRWL